MEIIDQLVMRSTVLQPLLRKNQQLQLIYRKAHNLLPLFLSQQCHVAYFNEEQHTLVIYANSSIWATRLRFFVPDFISLWQQDSFLQHLSLHKVETKICPSYPIQQTTLTSCSPISMQTSKLLRETAHSLTHPRLKSSLLKLADRATKS